MAEQSVVHAPGKEIGKCSIATFLRIKPVLGAKKVPSSTVAFEVVPNALSNSTAVLFDIPPDADPGLVHNNSMSGKLKFEFDHIFDQSTTQEDVFTLVAKERIMDAIDGINCTIFAYGQTGSGKTYSIFGGESYKERGLIPRSIGLVFAQIKARQKKQASFKFTCKISFTEIYKENIYDLLDKDSRTLPMEDWPLVQLMEGDSGGVVLRNLNVYEVTTEEEALQLFFMGNTNRITTSTSMNNMSSRSHAIFTIVLETEGIKDEKLLYTVGKINLVDLAGSERMYKMANTPGMINEAKSINLSLHYLEQVIITLRESSKQSSAVSKEKAANGFIPYRNSSLTSMLRDSLGGNCKSCFLLAASVERASFEETISTCRFGQRCGEVRVSIVANSEISLSDQLKDLNHRIKVLEKQLLTTEEVRVRLEAALEEEKELRASQTQLRTLTVQEKEVCKNCVQQLLVSAKESINSNSHGPSNNVEHKEGSLIEQSQELLYNTVERMDKAVLVELSTALGGLVQSMYSEREMAKLEESLKSQRERKAAEVTATKEREETQVLEFLKKGVHEMDPEQLSQINQLPPEKLKLVTSGGIFLKRSRYSGSTIRIYSLSEDLSTLCWRDLMGKKSDCTYSVAIKSFEKVLFHDSATGSPASTSLGFHGVDHGDAGDGEELVGESDVAVILLVGRKGSKSLHLKSVGALSEEANVTLCQEWGRILRFAVARLSGPGKR